MVETKVTLTTSEAEGHTHGRFFPEGPILAGTYRTSEGGEDDHVHFFVVEEDVQPGSSVVVTTSPPGGEEEGHQHEITVGAADRRAQASDEDDDEMARRHPCDRASDPHQESQAHDHPHDVPQAAAKRRVETKTQAGQVLEIKQETRNGVEVGIVAGYIATWQQDTGGIFGVPDQFVPGAFTKSLETHRARGNRPIRLKDHHGRTIGGFPIQNVREDDRGLFGVGEINLETQLGREAHSLARQGVLTDFSIGFVATDDKIEGSIRTIFEAEVVEGSIVDEPANREANILEVKAAVDVEEARELTVREIEEKLHTTGAFSRRAAKMLAGRLRPEVKVDPSPDPAPDPTPGAPATPCYDRETMASILRDLKEAKKVVGATPPE